MLGGKEYPRNYVCVFSRSPRHYSKYGSKRPKAWKASKRPWQGPDKDKFAYMVEELHYCKRRKYSSSEIQETIIDHVINHSLSFREAGQRVQPILSLSTVASIARHFSKSQQVSHNVTVYHCVFQLYCIALLAEQTVSTVMQMFHQSHLCVCHNVNFDMLYYSFSQLLKHTCPLRHHIFKTVNTQAETDASMAKMTHFVCKMFQHSQNIKICNIRKYFYQTPQLVVKLIYSFNQSLHNGQQNIKHSYQYEITLFKQQRVEYSYKKNTQRKCMRGNI